MALPPVLLATLRRHREAQTQEQVTADARWHESGLVFTTNIGTPIEPRNLIRHFKAALKKAGLLETIRFHDLQHSCATLLIAQGVHLRVVMEILRHSQISTTMNTYAHDYRVCRRTRRRRLRNCLLKQTKSHHETQWTDVDARLWLSNWLSKTQSAHQC
jgi:integrase